MYGKGGEHLEFQLILWGKHERRQDRGLEGDIQKGGVGGGK